MILTMNEYFGARNKHWEFDPLLIKCTRFSHNGKVLDCGVGKEGRNALFFSMLGYDVDGIDIDEQAVSSCQNIAKKLGVRINAWVCDIANTEIGKGKYSIILATYMWQYFSRDQAVRLIAKMKEALHIGGVIYIALFASNDICFKRVKNDPKFKLIEPNTYLAKIDNWWRCQTSSKDTYVHCFTKHELLSLFSDFELIHCSEADDIDIDHDDPHYHNVIVYIGRK